ncbi:hypothetical protein [Actinomadura atramentaria]|uniref:hypothetical protein n=1 Tax=Actinomadura atramentaria TaxID=1990 RepID=UPI003B8330C2
MALARPTRTASRLEIGTFVSEPRVGTSASEPGEQVTRWRNRAVDQLIDNGTIVSDAVAEAMRAVPRHRFIPEVAPQEAYEPFEAVVTKRDEEGNALSSVSDMHVQAFMLEEAGIELGMNVLEIGSGGYNAALI